MIVEVDKILRNKATDEDWENLILSLDNMIFYVIKKHFNTFIKYEEDLFQTGRLSIIENIKKFKEKKYKFSSFIYKVIHHGIARYITSYLKNLTKIKEVEINDEISNKFLYSDDNIYNKLTLECLILKNKSDLKKYEIDFYKDWMKGLNEREIATIWKVSHQRINKIKQNLISKLKGEKVWI